MRLAAYVRLSVANGSDSLEAQEEAIRAWAEAEGHEVASVHADDGKSGTLGAADRPGLLAALDEVASGRAGGLAVHRLDRLARELHVQEASLAAVWGAGGRAFEAVGGEVLQDDPDDPMRRAMRQMRGVFAELERAMVVVRMQGGRRRKAAAGGHVGGDPPYGWRVEGEGAAATLAEEPAEQAVLARARRMRRRGVTLRAIAATLDADGVPTRTGRPWASSTVEKITRGA